MSEFILGALTMFTLVAFWVVGRDYRRWNREREAYRYWAAKLRQKDRHYLSEADAGSPWSNDRWSA
jgi:hypothetical protein